MRKIINQPDSFVDEVVEAILWAHPDQLKAVDADRRALVRSDAGTNGRVGIVTGGGSGHLPLFLGYVGRGLASGCADGNVFSSPSPQPPNLLRTPPPVPNSSCTACRTMPPSRPSRWARPGRSRTPIPARW